MTLDSRDYNDLTDYLQRLYQCRPFTRAGIKHPVAVFRPDPDQVSDVDSVLHPSLPRPEKTDFAACDFSYLHSLQNQKPWLHNGKTFTLQRLSLNPLRLRASVGRYFDMLATCAALENELRDAAAQGWMRTPTRATYHRHISPSQSLLHGAKRSAAIGIGVLTVFNHDGVYKAMLARRSQRTAFDSGMYHVLPAMMFGPTTPDFNNANEWSARHQILREFLEELFDMPEQPAAHRWDFFYEHPALKQLLALMDAGKASLYLTGVVLNLLTLRPEIAALLLIRDPAWHASVTSPGSATPFKTADETVAGSVVHAPIADDHAFLSHFPPQLHLRMPAQATATLWLGIDLARELI